MKKIKFLMCLCLLFVSSVSATVINTVQTSGVLFKDTLETHMLYDKESNIACYLNLPSRTLSIEDQSDVAMDCVKLGDASSYTSKKMLFNMSKSWFFKNNVIDRIYDSSNNTMVYISYNRKMSGDNASSAISVVKL